MCGISGLVHSNPGQPVDRDLVRRLTATLAHRGPDADGFPLWPRRCPRPSPAEYHRPIHGRSTHIQRRPARKRWSSNGEIYNFRPPLRGRPRTAWPSICDSASPTSEVIVHAWEEYGDACVRRFRGMFAIALWDIGQRRLLLAARNRGRQEAPLLPTRCRANSVCVRVEGPSPGPFRQAGPQRRVPR